jgi:hypothetical protein
MNPLLDAALRYAQELGWPVFPLHTASGGRCSCGKSLVGDGRCSSPGKHPRTATGFKAATTDPDQIAAWWGQWPDANIGIPTGAASGIVVLDIDGKRGAEAIRERGGLGLRTPHQRTGRGEQYVFWRPNVGDFPNFTKALPDIDGRGDGGYIVAAPSLHSTGKNYAWLTDPFGTEPTEAPGWVYDLFLEAAAKSGSTKTRASIAPITAGEAAAFDDLELPEWQRYWVRGAGEGERNTAVTRIAGHFIGVGNGIDETISILSLWNRSLCRPPLDESELETAVNSISKRQRRKELATPQRAAQELESDSALNATEKQKVRLDVVSATLGIKIERVLKFDADPPLFHLQVNGVRVPVGDVGGLIEQIKLRKAVAAAIGRIINAVKKEEWLSVAQLLLDAAETLNLEDATQSGMLKRQLSAYLNDWEGQLEVTLTPDDVKAGHPFIHKGFVHINLTHLRTYIHQRLGEAVKAGELATSLRMAGANSTVLRPFEGRDSKTARAWEVPLDLVLDTKWHTVASQPAPADGVTAADGVTKIEDVLHD